MENSISKILVGAVVKKALREMKESPERTIRNLIDMALQFSGGRFQQFFFATAQTMLQNENSAYYQLVRDIISYADPERLYTFGMTTRSYYRELIQSGVKIYEYTKGFIHSKTFVSDDSVATVGTTNLDFRSLYLHFECGALIYNSGAVVEVKEDFLKTLAICQQVTEEDCRANVAVRLFQDVLRLFAPLM